ncbi:hypothetical protein V8E52_010917 [Russula decolorans]
MYGISQSCHLYLCRPVPHPPSIFDHYVYHNSNLGKQYWVGRLDPFVHSIGRLSGGPTITSIYSNLGKQYWVGRLDPFLKLNDLVEVIAKVGSIAGGLFFVALLIWTSSENVIVFEQILVIPVTLLVIVTVPEGLRLAVTLTLAFATN